MAKTSAHRQPLRRVAPLMVVGDKLRHITLPTSYSGHNGYRIFLSTFSGRLMQYDYEWSKWMTYRSRLNGYEPWKTS